MSLIVKTVSDSAQARQDLSKLRASVDDVKNSVDNTSKSLASIGRSIGLAVAGGVLVNSFVKISDELTNYGNKLRALTSTQKQFERALYRTKEIALNTRADLDSVARLYGRIALVSNDIGISQRSTLRVTELVSKTLKISGANAAEAAGSMQQFAQAIGSNRLSGEELRSVLENNGALAKALADGLGVAIGKLKELGEAGKLTAPVVIKALLKQGDKLDSVFSNLQITYGQAFLNLGTSFKLLYDSVVKTFLGSGSYIATWLNKIAMSIGQFALNFELHLYNAKVKAALFVVNVIQFFTNLWQVLKTVLSKIGEKLGSIFEKLKPELAAAGAAIVAFGKTAANALGNAFMKLKDFITSSSLFQRFANAVSNAAMWIRDTFTKVWNSIKLKMPSINMGKFFDSLKPILEKVKSWARAVEGWFKWLYDKVVGNSWIPDLVTQVGAWLKKLLGSPLAFIKSFVGSANGLFAKLAVVAPFTFALKQLSLLKAGLKGLALGGLGALSGIAAYEIIKNKKTNLGAPQKGTVDDKLSKFADDFKKWFHTNNITRNLKQFFGIQDKYPGQIYGETIDTNAKVGRGVRRQKESRPFLHDAIGMFPEQARAPIYLGLVTGLTLALRAAMAEGMVRTVAVSLFSSALLISMVKVVGSEATSDLFKRIAFSILNIFEMGFTKLLSGKKAWDDPAAFLGLIAKTLLLFQAGREMWMKVIKGVLSAPTIVSDTVWKHTVDKKYLKMVYNNAKDAANVIDKVVKGQERSVKAAADDLRKVSADVGRNLKVFDPSIGTTRNLRPSELQSRANRKDATNLTSSTGLPAAVLLSQVKSMQDSVKIAEASLNKHLMTQKAVNEKLDSAKEAYTGLTKKLNETKAAVTQGFIGIGAGLGGIIGGVGGFQVGMEIARGMENQPAWKKIGVTLATSFVGQFIGASLGLLATNFVVSIVGLLTAPIAALGGIFANRAAFMLGKALVTSGLLAFFSKAGAALSAAFTIFKVSVTALIAGIPALLAAFPLIGQIGAVLLAAGITVGATYLVSKLKETFTEFISKWRGNIDYYRTLTPEQLASEKANLDSSGFFSRLATWDKNLLIQQAIREKKIEEEEKQRAEEIRLRKEHNAKLKQQFEQNLKNVVPLTSTSDSTFIFPQKYANGGWVRGPGGPRDDKIPALLSNGEYVINANTAQKFSKGGVVMPPADVQGYLGDFKSLLLKMVNPFSKLRSAKNLTAWASHINKYLDSFINNTDISDYDTWGALYNSKLPFAKGDGITFLDASAAHIVELLNKVKASGGTYKSNAISELKSLKSNQSAKLTKEQLAKTISEQSLIPDGLKKELLSSPEFLSEATEASNKIESLPWRSVTDATVASYFKIVGAKFAKGGLFNSFNPKSFEGFSETKPFNVDPELIKRSLKDGTFQAAARAAVGMVEDAYNAFYTYAHGVTTSEKSPIKILNTRLPYQNSSNAYPLPTLARSLYINFSDISQFTKGGINKKASKAILAIEDGLKNIRPTDLPNQTIDTLKQLGLFENNKLKDQISYIRNWISFLPWKTSKTYNASEYFGISPAELLELEKTNNLYKGFKSASRFASGGWIRGQGTGTSDSIPALLSNGEFVINARSAAKHRKTLEYINGVGKYAQGGLVFQNGGAVNKDAIWKGKEYADPSRSKDIIQVHVASSAKGAFGEIWEAIKSFDASKISAAVSTALPTLMQSVKNAIGWKEPVVPTGGTGEVDSTPFQTTLKRAGKDYANVFAKTLKDNGIEGVKAEDILELKGSSQQALIDALDNIRRLERERKSPATPEFMKNMLGKLITEGRDNLGNIVSKMVLSGEVDAWKATTDSKDKEEGNIEKFGQQFNTVSNVFPELGLIEDKFLKLPDDIRNALYNAAAKSQAELNKLNDRPIGPLGTETNLKATEAYATIETNRKAALSNLIPQLKPFRNTFDQNKNFLEDPEIGISEAVFALFSDSVKNYVLNLEQEFRKSKTVLEDNSSDDAKKMAAASLDAIKAKVEKAKARAGEGLGGRYAWAVFEKKISGIDAIVDISFYNKLTDAQQKSFDDMLNKLEDARMETESSVESIRIAAQQRVDALSKRIKRDIEKLKTDKLTEIAEAFGNNITQSFKESTKGAFKGEVDKDANGIDKSIAKTYVDRILDNVTKNVIEAFVEGMAESVLGQGIQENMKSFGAKIFGLGSKFIKDIFGAGGEKKKTADASTATTSPVADAAAVLFKTLDETTDAKDTKEARPKKGGLVGFGEGVATIVDTAGSAINSAIDGLDIASWFKKIPDALGKIDFAGMFDSVISGAKRLFSMFATGGWVNGPGTSTSDSIPAMLSVGEFVVNAKAARKFGPLLSSINNGSISKLSEGGFVSRPSIASISESSSSRREPSQVININITGDISRQTKAQIYEMLPQIASGVNMHNRETGYRG
jgi:tape measure domain-containing protein